MIPTFSLPRTLALAAALVFGVSSSSVHAAATAPTLLHSFNGYSEGAYPRAPLVRAADGSFYGVAGNGGSATGVLGKGTIFKIDTAGTVTTLASFPAAGTGGSGPNSLVLAGDGKLYGTTSLGGTKGYGVVFKVTTGGTLTTLYSFTNGTDGGYPGGIVVGKDGNLYGTTSDGGASSYGTLFQITTGGTLTTLHAFTGGTDGATPTAAPVVGTDGILFGTTSAGGITSGDSGAGTVWRSTTDGTLLTRYSFTGGDDGAAPVGAIILADFDSIYGTTSANHGTVFCLRPSESFATLHTFNGTTDGDRPVTGLVRAGDGLLYGTTPIGGVDGNGKPADGTLFSVSLDGTFTVVSTFVGGGTALGAANPGAALTLGGDGNLYGTTVNGGASSYGTCIKVAISGGHPPFFSGEVVVEDPAYYLAFPNGNNFGYYAYLTDQHFIYHFDLGYEYWFDAADGKSGIYFYDFASESFFYTSPTFPFPYLYDFSLNSVLYYYPDPNDISHYTTNPRYFYNFAMGEIISK